MWSGQLYAAHLNNLIHKPSWRIGGMPHCPTAERSPCLGYDDVPESGFVGSPVHQRGSGLIGHYLVYPASPSSAWLIAQKPSHTAASRIGARCSSATCTSAKLKRRRLDTEAAHIREDRSCLVSILTAQRPQIPWDLCND